MEAVLQHLKQHRKLVFLDLEGTQFSHEIIAIGAVKVSIDEKGHLINMNDSETFKIYVKSLGQIGKVVQNMTKITEETLRNEGVSLEEALNKFKEFIGGPIEECTYIVFGTNDAKMIIDSLQYSRPENVEIGYEIVKNIFDYLAFVSQYIKDDKGNNYSLVNYLKVFGINPHGESHDPLNDAYDLMNLYNALDTQKEILLVEYLKVLQKQRLFPQPIKEVIAKLTNGEDVSSSNFLASCKKYLA